MLFVVSQQIHLLYGEDNINVNEKMRVAHKGDSKGAYLKPEFTKK